MVVGVLLFSGGKPAPSPKKADPVSLTVAPAPAPAPAVKTAPLAASAGKTAEGPTAPLELKPQELSPKELYELRVKEGLIKPATPAPAEEPPIATTGEGWEEPFAAGSLDAWTQRLGSWAFEGGVLYSDSAQSQNKQGHLLSKVDYRDFELTASFRVTGGNVDHFHFQWHGNDKSVAPGGTISEWHAFRVLVRGHEFSATVGGKPVRVLGQHNLLAQGTFGFYCFGGAKLELKDVRLRRLAPPASPSAALSADWKPLFDGTSLNGWEQLKGSFGVADGTIASASIDENTKAVMLATVDAYADFEAAGSFMVTGHPYVEIHLMGGPDLGEHNFTFDTEVGSWHAFLVRMEGDRPTLALDGKDVPLRVRSPKPLNGVRLGIWKGIQGQLLLKDVRIRSILPPVQVVQAVPPAPGGNEPWSEPFAAGLDAWEQRKGAWTIQDGILSGDSRTSDTGQNLLASKETYADFELTTLFRTSGGHRHVYVHYHDFDKNIQATGVGPEWHALRLLVRGNAFAASVDGAPAHVVDAGGAKADGSIGFFINESGMVEFKDFKLRRLEPVKPAGGEGGWISLFDGKSHDAWTVAKGSAAVEDGLLVLTDTQAAGGARLDGKQAFENFEFEMEFQHTKENYLELYLQSAVAGAKSHGWQFNASLHGWHKARIVFAGDRPALSLDGKEIPLSNAGTAASVRLSFWKGHQGQLKMRNLRVRPLAVATEPAPAPAPAPEPKEAAPNDAEWTDLLEGG
ncbi:MAG: DUF1080 domain-containing protein [Planctomycetota bacterium]|nr:DUF1080 domain-containing protein [Planctomycetota bacterium]